MRAAARRVLSFLSDVDCFPRSEMDPSLSSLVRCFQAPHRLRAAQQSCQDMTFDKSPADHLARRSSGAAAMLPAVITHHVMTRTGAALLDEAPIAK